MAWWKPCFLRLLFKTINAYFGRHKSKTTISSSLSGWQWISKGLNCVRFLFKFVTWKIGPLSHLNDIFLSCLVMLSCASLYWCLVVPCLERADLLALVCDVYCEGVTFQLVILGQVWAWLIDSWSLPSFLLPCVSSGQHPQTFYFMHNLVFEKSGILLFASLDCIILHINGKQFRCSVFTFVQYITNTGITDLNDIEKSVNRCILLINWVSLCPFYQQ